MALGIPSFAVPLVDRYRKIEESWAPFFKRLVQDIKAADNAAAAAQTTANSALSTANTNAVAIIATNAVIDGIEAQWGIAVQSNTTPPVVLGLVRLDAGASGSVFKIQADKFVVSLPTDVNNTMTAFIAGLVDGVPTVGINGNLVVDDTILARHINVSSLSAIVANIGTVTAGKLQSNDGKVLFDLDNKILRMET